MKLIFGCLLIVMLVATGCSDGENNETSNDEQIQSQPLNYETKEEQNERLGLQEESIGEKGGYPQTKQNNINRGDNTTGNNMDMFTNDQSKKIADYLMNRADIKLAQVAISDEKIVVGVMLNDHSDHEITTDIKKDVRKFDSNKIIVVYTDDIHWDRMSNLKAKLKQTNLPDNIKDDMKRLFNPDR